MSQSGDAEIVQAKITAARRDAEGLKDKIKRKKDDLTDATRKFSVPERVRQRLLGFRFYKGVALTSV